ncbi:hypothetical protein JKA74_09300 [Marivirga sp. S37H4]|uniref:DUF6265 domain-containing protein n=1 Tax=Marivirga aurantiaca TaxID=2802615 RepID=A0A934WYA8_9BACT|nr:DUF6265 family protein [Marivirga aurantiaca]MBK6265234.1 hypothetical protein [Marivirga aurantiaca]
MAFLLLLAVKESNRKDPIQQASWLLGCWENKTSIGSTYESWTEVNELEFSGKSYAVKGKDTMVFETIQLIQKEEELFYIPSVKKQNEGLPVAFKMVEISESFMKFENKAHDFPQAISYTRISSDSLVAEISGEREGQIKKVLFPMKRIN